MFCECGGANFSLAYSSFDNSPEYFTPTRTVLLRDSLAQISISSCPTQVKACDDCGTVAYSKRTEWRLGHLLDLFERKYHHLSASKQRELKQNIKNLFGYNGRVFKKYSLPIALTKVMDCIGGANVQIAQI